MPRETSQSILEWGDATFGKVDNPLALVTRAREELTELEEALADDDANGAAQEAADVVILLHRLVGLMGKDLSQEVDAKMAINRKRKWKAAGDGTGGHI